MGDRAVQHGHLPVRKRRICHARPGIRTRRELAKIYALLGFCYAVIIISYITGFFAKIEFEFPEADASLIFCPTYYAGCGATPDARAYLKALGRVLDPEVYLFWTGDDVVTPRITRGCAAAFRKIVNHRLIIWDNYPVNDRNPTLHLGPVKGASEGCPQGV